MQRRDPGAGNRWSFLRYERERFADFTLHVEFLMAPKGNAGVGLRTGSEETATKPLASHVCLQNHGHDVWFRNVTVRPLRHPADN